MSAAGNGRGESLISCMPLSKICQARDKTDIDRFCAKNAAAFAFGLAGGGIDEIGRDFPRGDQMDEIGQISHDLARIGAGVILALEIGQRRRDIALHHRSNRSMMRLRSARPSIRRRLSAWIGAPAPCAMA